MVWYRIAYASYPQDIAQHVFAGEPTDRWPNFVSLETSKLSSPITSVNVVYYKDMDAGDECGDFFFTSVREALDWCCNELQLDLKSFIFFDPPRRMPEYD
jgi:hypothetical protein